MSFAGHVLDMIKRNNQNAELRKKHRSAFQKVSAKSKLNRRIIFPTIPKEKLDRIKNNIRSKAKKEKQIIAVKVVLILSIGILFFYFAFPIVIEYVSQYLDLL